MTALCQCGCGQPAPIATKSNTARGRVKGQPQRFIAQHHRRSAPVDYVVDDETGCWVWQLSTYGTGYGQVNRGGRRTTAHRWYYEQRHGSVPEGLELDHTCENPLCVNPDHLEPVTHQENIRRHYQGRAA